MTTLRAVHLLLVEDDLKLGALLDRVLRDHGYRVTLQRTVAEVRALCNEDIELAIVDWMLPDGDGLEVCTALRRSEFEGAILMLTARGELADKVKALDSGADDYLTKPFELDELLARLRALKRRVSRAHELDAGPIHLDLRKRYAFVDGALLDLTSREYELLAYLVRKVGVVVSKLELLENVWEGGEVVVNAVEVHVSRLRDKLGAHARLIETVRGQGYRLVAP